MDIHSIEQQIQDIVAASAPPKVRANGQWQKLSLPELDIDSLAFAELSFKFEEAFNVEIPFEKLDPAIQRMPALDVCRALAETISGLMTAKAA